MMARKVDPLVDFGFTGESYLECEIAFQSHTLLLARFTLD